MTEPVRILAIDVGGGTQDVLVYDSSVRLENCVKMILPAQTQVVAARIRRATRVKRPVVLTGPLMGGGASNEAVEEHLLAGLPVWATPEAAQTLHNNLERVERLGVQIARQPPEIDADVIRLGDVDLEGIEAALARFEVEMPSIIAIAVQDHGYVPGAGGRAFRSEYLHSLLENGGEARNMIFREPPEPMIRMRAVVDQIPGAYVMDTGAAAVLGSLGDPAIAEHAAGKGAILINIGNLHTFAVAFRGSRIYGLFEHHTGGVTPEWLSHLVDQLRAGSLTHQEVMEHGGHGAAFSSDYAAAGPFEFVAVTGPNRHIAAPLGYHQAVPHGDMMLSGPYGLIDATLRVLQADGHTVPSLANVR